VAHAIKRIETEDNGAKPWPEHAYRFVLEHAPEDIRRMTIIGRATGQRRSDLVRVRPVDRHEQGIRFKIGKLRDKSHWVPLTIVAAAEIDSWGVEPMVPYLLSATSRPAAR
jgi:integrase